MLVAFMPWNGYNFEDSILISERVVKDDVFTSIHIEEFEVVARDTKLGPEEITRDIPNVGEEALRNLDEAGIVYIGAEVEPGDILVGKVTPKGETPLTPEEKLLRAIFGEKASDVKDTSLRLPPGIDGTVIDVRVFNRAKASRRTSARCRSSDEEVERLPPRPRRRAARSSSATSTRACARCSLGKTAVKGPQGRQGRHGHRRGAARHAVARPVVTARPRRGRRRAEPGGAARPVRAAEEGVRAPLRGEGQEAHAAATSCPRACMKMVKVYVAVKRRLQPGDKMAGRHGNKGVVSKIVPVEDMPYMADGTPVDIVLNPLGVPSRMNVGQILETHLGWAAQRPRPGDRRRCCRSTATRGDMTPLKEAMKIAYGADGLQRGHRRRCTDDEFLELAGNVTAGVPIATPVFDGANGGRRSTTRCERAGLPTPRARSIAATTAAPASSSTGRSRSATCTC